MLEEDPELERLRTVPGLVTDALGEFRDQFGKHTEVGARVLGPSDRYGDTLSPISVARFSKPDACAGDMTYGQEFIDMVLEKHRLKQAEFGEWQGAMASAAQMKEEQASIAIARSTSRKKQRLHEAPVKSPVADEELHNTLMDLELQTVEALEYLTGEFEGHYGEIMEATSLLYSSYFSKIRELEITYQERLTKQATKLLERVATGTTRDSNNIQEEAWALLHDKVAAESHRGECHRRSIAASVDKLLGMIHSSHDAHIAKMDALEDELASEEKTRLEEMLGAHKTWATQRNRERVREILGLQETPIDPVGSPCGTDTTAA
eukprot:scaffold3822_cov379-Prasinococcus_capsulatus_cf.AAC.8